MLKYTFKWLAIEQAIKIRHKMPSKELYQNHGLRKIIHNLNATNIATPKVAQPMYLENIRLIILQVIVQGVYIKGPKTSILNFLFLKFWDLNVYSRTYHIVAVTNTRSKVSWPNTICFCICQNNI